MNERSAHRLDTIPIPQGEGDPTPAIASSPAGPAPTEGFEEQYQKIGRWKGPDGTREAQARVREFWLSQGAPGLRWLAARLRREGHIDALDGAAALLSDAGRDAITPILEELERQPTIDQADALLKALKWIGEYGAEAQPSSMTQLEAVLVAFLQHSDTDLREYAALSTRLLPRERALGLLRERLDAETDANVRETIEDVINIGVTGRG